MAIFHKIPETRYTLDAVIKYITDSPRHSGKVLYYDGVMVNPFDAALSMLLIKQIYAKEGGSQYKHFIISLEENETPEYLYTAPQISDGRCFPWMAFSEIAWMMGQTCNCQAVYAVHTNTKHVHMHIVMNSVNFDGEKLNLDYRLFITLIQKINEILKNRGLKEIRTYSGFAINNGEVVDVPQDIPRWEKSYRPLEQVLCD